MTGFESWWSRRRGEIDEVDASAPIPLSENGGEAGVGDVGGFLEGFLEEVLVRIEE
jgi:hypothetical protein